MPIGFSAKHFQSYFESIDADSFLHRYEKQPSIFDLDQYFFLLNFKSICLSTRGGFIPYSIQNHLKRKCVVFLIGFTPYLVFKFRLHYIRVH